MILIIDAYNYIKQVVQVSFVQERTIQEIIKQFIEYVHLRGNEVVLVFDAGPYHQITHEQVHGLLSVWYSGHYFSADDVIKKILEEKRGLDILVVSSDREICAHAQMHNVVSIGSLEFDRIFKQILKAQKQVDKKIKGTLIKTSDNLDASLDDLMEMASRSLVSKDKQFEVHTYNILQSLYSAHTLSKIDKRLLKKISKI